MADLSMTLTKLKKQVAYRLGYGRAYPSDSTSKQALHVDDTIDRGLSQFYMPGQAGVPDIPLGHKWSFLAPRTTIVVWSSVSDTISAADTTTITCATAVFYDSMVGKSVVVGSNSYPITATNGTHGTAGTVATVTGDPNAETGTFTVTADGDYRLPDDWGSIASKLVYDDELGRRPVEWGAAEDVQRYRNDVTSTGYPHTAAVVPVSQDGSAAQKWNLMVHRTPDNDYTLHYRYNVLATALGGTSTEYPYGGAEYGEVILASCLAVCELEKQGAQGGMWANFVSKLQAAIGNDRVATGPQELGALTRPEEGYRAHPRDITEAYSENAVIYNGVTY